MKGPAFLDQRGLELLLFGGKGGAGKTTCACAAALRLAAAGGGRSFLLVSTDPAHSLADSLAGLIPPANLRVLELDSQDCLARFRAAHGETLRQIAAAGTFLDDEDIRQFLDLSLPGLDELVAFLEITGWVEARSYHGIVVDTAPSGHALRLLEMPELIRQWLEMLDALLGKRRYLRRVFSRSAARDSLDLFVDRWGQSLRTMEALLRDPARCAFVPVTLAEPLSVGETAALLAQLRRRSIPVAELVVNQLHPASVCPACAAAHLAERRQLETLRSLGPSVWEIPLRAREVCGAELRDFWDGVAPAAGGPAATAACRLPHVAGTGATHPSAELQLILFAGKGGVGKTTLACGTALRLARDFPEKHILLVSTDPAHSLSACFRRAIGPRPTALPAGPSAMELDARAEFRALQSSYAADMRDFLESVCGNFDLTFDRAVLEKLLDLAPPGLDEIMALARLAGLLAEDRYHLFVLDPASTGHFLRLLELPQLIDQWLKTFFAFFLKYDKILRLPGFSSQLVELSRNLKQFRALLADPARAALYAVSIPTEMAFAETADLLAACARMGLAVRALFLNLMTPAAGCRLCAGLLEREARVAARFRREFPNLEQIPIYRRAEMRLEELGSELFREVAVYV